MTWEELCWNILNIYISDDILVDWKYFNMLEISSPAVITIYIYHSTIIGSICFWCSPSGRVNHSLCFFLRATKLHQVLELHHKRKKWTIRADKSEASRRKFYFITRVKFHPNIQLESYPQRLPFWLRSVVCE